MEVVARLAVAPCNQHVGDAATLGAGQEGRDEGIGRVQLRVHPQRPPRQEHRDDRNTGRLQPLQQRKVALVFGAVFQCRAVAGEFGVGRFAEHDDRSIGLGRIRAIDRQRRLAAARPHRLVDPAPDRLTVREGGIGDARALPGDRPTARLLADIVRAAAGDEDIGTRLQRQHPAVVLEQHERFTHRLTRDRAMLGRTQQVELARHRPRRRAPGIERARQHLDPQDPPYRIVQPRGRDRPVLRLAQRVRVQLLPLRAGIHEHVEARIDRCRAILVAAPRHLAVRVPVPDREAVEAHALLQHAGQQTCIAGHLDAVPAGKARHYGQRARGKAAFVARSMHVAQHLFADARIALIAAAGAAIAQEMLHRGNDMAGRHEVLTDRALQPFDHLSGIGLNDLWLFRIAFVGPTPAVVLHHRHRRREAPVDAGRRRFRRGRRADTPDQRRVARRAKADIVREQRRADDIVVAMHRVGAPDDRHDRPPIAALHRRVVERVEQLQPFRGRGEFIAVGRRIAAVEDRTEFVRLEVLGRDRGDIDLDQLADLILHAHPLQDRVDPCLDLRIAFQLHR